MISPSNVHNHRIFGRYYSTRDILLMVAACIFPPLATGLQKGFSKELFVCCLLTLMAQFPGFIYAMYLIWQSSLTAPDYYIIPANDVEAIPATGEITIGNNDDNTQRDVKKSTTEISKGDKNTGSTSKPDVGSSSAPPTYEEATKNGKVPVTGDFKVQK